MGKCSKATTSLINNLQKSKINQKSTVEELSDDEDPNFDDKEDLKDSSFTIMMEILFNTYQIPHPSTSLLFNTCYA